MVTWGQWWGRPLTPLISLEARRDKGPVQGQDAGLGDPGEPRQGPAHRVTQVMQDVGEDRAAAARGCRVGGRGQDGHSAVRTQRGDSHVYGGLTQHRWPPRSPVPGGSRCSHLGKGEWTPAGHRAGGRVYGADSWSPGGCRVVRTGGPGHGGGTEGTGGGTEGVGGGQGGLQAGRVSRGRG